MPGCYYLFPSRRWLYALAFGGAAAAALLVSGQTYLSMLDHGHDFWRMLGWQLGCWSYWALLAPLVIERSAARVAADGSWRSRLAGHVGVAIGLTFVHLLVAAAFTALLQPFRPVVVRSFGDSFEAQIVPWTYVDLLLYGTLVASGLALAAYRRNRELELHESRLAADLARAQLEALRLEIEPHFLFNTLNSIAALVRRDRNQQALDMLVGLGELLRSTLEGAHRQEIPLRQELDFARRYLELQRARYGERLEVDFRIDEAAADVAVPTLLLQPLVENSLRHGLAPRARRGRIEVAARLDNGQLRLSVLDDGLGLPEGFELEHCPGRGLANTRSRLEQLHLGAARLEIRRRESAGTEVVVWLPAGRGADSGAPLGA